MKVLIAILIVITAVVVMAVGFLLGGLVWMLCLGSIASVFGYPVLAISYWSSVLVCTIFWLMFGGFVGTARNLR